MLKKLFKKLFPKEDPIVSEEVDLDDLGEWLNNKISKNNFNEEIATFFDKIKEQKSSITEKLSTLEQAEIDPKEKDKIEPRVKNIVSGHRDNYV